MTDEDKRTFNATDSNFNRLALLSITDVHSGCERRQENLNQIAKAKGHHTVSASHWPFEQLLNDNAN